MTAQPASRMSRKAAIPLVQRVLNPETPDEESSEILEALQRGLACPHISDYVYWDPDPEPTAEKIVDRAMAYMSIAL
ncbi:e9imm peptide [Streptomyces sp. NPDC056169]|uniref:e9imm peptide n=1 Tax=Streptomyces sp. NPDC056169 TaxID=3345734 RepID=UPI0035D840A1